MDAHDESVLFDVSIYHLAEPEKQLVATELTSFTTTPLEVEVSVDLEGLKYNLPP